ncbi:hypothetical protein [Pontibacter litorisediminis]|uniref:hypothetical protein n=1 Tax=Pontibacter litorisediminis TaxID=1846260 RepID=UPI0023ED3E77|nr:hypothetical protein [Pontibacter litorisediminis]
MKKLLVMICMVFGCVFAAKATGDKSSKLKAVAEARAQHLSDQMIKDLRLNNYQSRKIREINLQVAEQVTAIEAQYASNQQKVEELCKSVFAERDMLLENVLSTVQYNHYFGDRKVYRAADQKFMASFDNQNAGSVAVADNSAANQATVSID